jgi:hypothetical protein
MVIGLKLNVEKNFMSLLKFIGILVIGEITQMCLHLFHDGQLTPRWSDIPSLAAIMFGVSPYGQACYSWVKAKLAVNK